jgi:hypothetical protein
MHGAIPPFLVRLDGIVVKVLCKKPEGRAFETP